MDEFSEIKAKVSRVEEKLTKLEEKLERLNSSAITQKDIEKSVIDILVTGHRERLIHDNAYVLTNVSVTVSLKLGGYLRRATSTTAR